MSCAGHFCQLAVALHSYADAHDGAYPPGTVLHPDLPPERRLSWWVSILPHVEQQKLTLVEHGFGVLHRKLDDLWRLVWVVGGAGRNHRSARDHA